MATTLSISMTSFGDFVASDALGQLARVKEIRRQQEQPYVPGGDFWSRWREGVAQLHDEEHQPSALRAISANAKDNRGAQYRSACNGYAKFWGKRQIEMAGFPKPALWRYDRLGVRVNPEWVLCINGKLLVVKLHLKQRLVLNQRLANPVLHLLHRHFGPGAKGPAVAILDVHRGKLWRLRTENRDLDAVLRMQAAALIAGWDELDSQRQRGAA